MVLAHGGKLEMEVGIEVGGAVGNGRYLARSH